MRYSIRSLINDAKNYAKKGEWNPVDKQIIPRLQKYRASSVMKYLPGLFRSQNGDVRDLAGTVATAIKAKDLPNIQKVRLRTALQRELFSEDPNVFALFRAAVALTEHGIYEDKDLPRIREIFDRTEIQNDPELKEIADRYKIKTGNP